IPSLRGDLISRPIGEVMNEAENLLKSGVRELLVVSQDTSAYGVDVKYRTGFWRGRPVKTRMSELVQALSELAGEHNAWVRLHYVYPYPHVDEIIALMPSISGAFRVVPTQQRWVGRRPLSGRAVQARGPALSQADEASRRTGESARTRSRVACHAAGNRDPQHFHRRLPRRDRSRVRGIARLPRRSAT